MAVRVVVIHRIKLNDEARMTNDECKNSATGQRGPQFVIPSCFNANPARIIRHFFSGHSSFKILTPAGNVLLVDPWITNPSFDKGEEQLAALKRVDLILLTHGHGDHVGNAVEIGKRTGAKLVSTYDLAEAMKLALGYPAELADNDTIGAFGGHLSLLDGDATVCFVPAWHGSGVLKDEMSPPIYAGNPSGLVVTIHNGPTIYHTGDTAFFSDI